MAEPAYKIPALKSAEIVQHCKQYWPAANVTLSDLKNPVGTRVICILQKIAEDVIHSSVEEKILQNSDENMAPDTPGSRLMKINICLSEIFARIGFDERLNILDFFELRTKRLQKILSCAINFRMFEESIRPKIDEFAQAENQLMQQFAELSEQRELLKKEDAELAENLDGVRAHNVEMDAMRRALTTEMNVIMEEAEDDIKRCSNLEKELASESEGLEKKEAAAARSESEKERLSAQLVKSPDHFQAQLVHKQQEQARIQVESDQLIRELQEYKQQVKERIEIREKVVRLTHTTKNLQDVMSALGEQRKHCAVENEEVQKLQAQNAKSQKKIQPLMSKKTELTQKLENNQFQSGKQSEQLIAAVQDGRKLLSGKQKKIDVEIQKIQEEIRKNRADYAEVVPIAQDVKDRLQRENARVQSMEDSLKEQIRTTINRCFKNYTLP